MLDSAAIVGGVVASSEHVQSSASRQPVRRSMRELVVTGTDVAARGAAVAAAKGAAMETGVMAGTCTWSSTTPTQLSSERSVRGGVFWLCEGLSSGTLDVARDGFLSRLWTGSVSHGRPYVMVVWPVGEVVISGGRHRVREGNGSHVEVRAAVEQAALVLNRGVPMASLCPSVCSPLSGCANDASATALAPTPETTAAPTAATLADDAVTPAPPRALLTVVAWIAAAAVGLV